MIDNFNQLVELAQSKASVLDLSNVYTDRLNFEILEIKKQGAESIWLNYVKDGKKFVSNPNNLVLPWLLEMVDDDPIVARKDLMLNTVKAATVLDFKKQHGFTPHDLIKDPDSPDIDIDCLPDARDPIKQYAIQKYGSDFNDGYGSVCSAGTWQTYKFKLAIIDAAIALGLMTRYEASQYTTQFPEDVDELKEGGKSVCLGKVRNQEGEEENCGFAHSEIRCPQCTSEETNGPTIGKLLNEYPIIQELNAKYPQLIDAAINLVGRIRNMGMHAGAMIITDRPLYGNIPLARSSNKGYWVSMWTEGRNTQLSKFGYVKWDILGLKTLGYIYNCCRLIEQNRGISFGNNLSGWDDIDPTQSRRGHFFDANGNKKIIELNDPHVLQLYNDLKTEGIFQFDTDLARSTLANKVTNFLDLNILMAMGHPGPMDSIAEVVKNRDDKTGLWKKKLHPLMLEILEPTYGNIVYQEQLTTLWQKIAGFTATEAQEARKAVAKKYTEKIKIINKKWIDGASKVIGQTEAEEWADRMVSFGRYAFNLSHSISYCLVSYATAWLKTYFAPEWWTALMSDCHPDKLIRYMEVARSESWQPAEITYCGNYRGNCKKLTKVEFGTLNINRLTTKFSVTGDIVNQGLIGVKGIGEKAAEIFQGEGDYKDVDEFVAGDGKRSKIVMERLIKLGAFKHLHSNSKALWLWYQYKYCSGCSKQEIKQKLLEAENWTEANIAKEIERWANEYKRNYPKRHKVPNKITKWRPKPNDSREKVMALVKNDFSLKERLSFQKQFLGYWLEMPLDMYICSGNRNIARAKVLAKKKTVQAVVEGVIIDINEGTTKTDSTYLKLSVSDGIQKCLIFVWSNELVLQDLDQIQVGIGVSIPVDYDDKRNSFCLSRGETINKLLLKETSNGIDDATI